MMAATCSLLDCGNNLENKGVKLFKLTESSQSSSAALRTRHKFLFLIKNMFCNQVKSVSL